MNSVIAEKQYIVSKLGVPYDSLSQSYLRSETALSTTSVIPFQLQRGQVASPIVTEQLLELNDQFVITHIGFGLKQISGTDTPTTLQQLNANVLTYNDTNTFTGTNAVNVGAIYNTSLSMTINRKDFIPAMPMRSFLRVPDTQTTTNADYTTSGIKQTNGFPNGLYSFYPTEVVLIDGRQTLDIQINLGASVSFDDSNNSIYAVLEFRGYLVVNAKS
jgi:hydrogenase maturation factor